MHSCAKFVCQSISVVHFHWSRLARDHFRILHYLLTYLHFDDKVSTALPRSRHKNWYSCSRMSILSQSRFSLINSHFFMQAGRERQDGTRGKIVSCVMCDVTTRRQALGVFSENYRKRVILSTLNVNISESEATFPLEFRHCSASVPHYRMT